MMRVPRRRRASNKWSWKRAQMHNFVKTAPEIARLGLHAQKVIALRATKIAAGGAAAHTEVLRMIIEKVSAGAGAVAILAMGGSGQKVIRHYRKHVASNARRLSRR